MKLKFLKLAEKTMDAIIHFLVPKLESLREKVCYCQDCGQNRYTGKPCK